MGETMTDLPRFTRRPGQRLVRSFTPREREVAAGILDELSYKEIGERMRPMITAETVRNMVKLMALKIDGLDELAPRHRIFAILQWERWDEQQRAAAQQRPA